MQVKFAKTEQDWRDCFPVMQQLRPQYSLDAFLKQIAVQVDEGYQLAYVTTQTGDLAEQVVAVAGFVISHKLAWGKHMYIDDLVTNEHQRSAGAGKLLLNTLEQYAQEQGCEQLHLDSGVQRFGAHRFYLREGMIISSHHFQLQLGENPSSK